MNSFARFILLLTASFLPIAPFASAATVSGTVKGPDGAPFQAAFVEAQNTETRVTVIVLSDKNGRYRIEKLPAGEYDVQLRAAGYRGEPKNEIRLTAAENTSIDFVLQKGLVRWSDLSLYQGEKLLPVMRGHDTLFDSCFICHGFQTKMASFVRSEDGWRGRVNYMRQVEHAQLADRITDQKASDVVFYLNSLFGEDSKLPRSPEDMPEYKDLVRTFGDESTKIVYVEYELPGPSRMPWSAVPDKDGNLWLPYYGPANKIGKLNPDTGKVQEFQVSKDRIAELHSGVPAPDGTVWLAEYNLNTIGHLDPKTGVVTDYPHDYAPGKQGVSGGGSKHTVRVDQKGYVWTTGVPLTRLDPRTGKYTDFNEVPSSYGAVIDQSGNCWFAEFVKDGKIGRIDGNTLEVKKWNPPVPNSYPRRIQVDSQGIVWFDQSRAGKIARFDPKTEGFKEYDLPGADPSPYALTIDKNKKDIWYSSADMDTIGRLDPTTGHVTEYPFPHSENTMREFYLDSKGRIWYATPSNNKVGYFYVPEN